MQNSDNNHVKGASSFEKYFSFSKKRIKENEPKNNNNYD